MYNLYILNETYTNGYNDLILPIFSTAAVLCGIFVIVSKNPITSLFFLIGLFLSIACYLIILGLNFIGLSYLLVYVGAVSILFLFILMLINVRISELLSETSKSTPLAIITAVSFYYPILEILPNSLSLLDSSTANRYYKFKDVWSDYSSIGYFTKLFGFFSKDNEISFVTTNS
jgi:NADH-ubiquinone oxidoreductase chain 6